MLSKIKSLFISTRKEALQEVKQLIFDAISEDDPRKLKALLEQYEGENVRDEHGNTALHLAVKAQSAGCVNQLLDFNAKVLGSNQDQLCALHTACALGNAPIARILMLRGKLDSVYCTDKRGYNILHFAVQNNHLEVIRTVLEILKNDCMGVKLLVDMKEIENQCDPVAMAFSMQDRADIAFAILELGQINPDRTTDNGWTLLHFVSQSGSLKLLRRLLEFKPSVQVSDLIGQSPLHHAVINGHYDVAKELLAFHIYQLVRDTAGNTALHYCQDVPMAALLLDNIPASDLIDKYWRNKNGDTPAEHCARNNLTEVAAFLDQKMILERPPSDVKLRLQVCSDLHIEFKGPVTVDAHAPYLALLGDIGLCVKTQYRNFLLSQAEKFKRVLVLHGNHEYYNFHVEGAIATTKDICKQRDNLTYMERTSELIDGVRVLGTILWSDVPDNFANEVTMSLNDYRRIRIDCPEEVIPADAEEPRELQDIGEPAKLPGRSLTVADTVKWHKESVKWLETEIEEAKRRGEIVVILSHHCPLYKFFDSDPSYWNGAMYSAFSTDMSHLFGYPVAAWVYGHLHKYNDVTVKGTRIISNPLGYPREKVKNGYDPKFVLEV